LSLSIVHFAPILKRIEIVHANISAKYIPCVVYILEHSNHAVWDFPCLTRLSSCHATSCAN
jgi:hypothetical protein